MPAPAYQLTNYPGSTDPAGGILALIETQLTSAGWVFVEAYPFTQAATARVMRVWKNPSTLNASGTDFYIGIVKNVAAGVYIAMRVFEVWDAVGKTIDRPCIVGNATTIPGDSFIQRVLPNSPAWSSVAYGNGVFVAVAQNTNNCATSPDGITWTPRNMPATTGWISVIFGAGVFVAVAINSAIAATSPDGITWTQRVLPVVGNWVSVAFGAGVFVAVANTTVAATSPDGITWTQRAMPSSGNWVSVAFGAGVFVAVLQNSTAAASSPDGVTWTLRFVPVAVSWSSVTFGAGVFVAIATANSNIAATSPDGITWTQRVLPASTTWQSVTFGAGVFIAVASGNIVAATSPDGITWTQRILPATATWISVAYGNGVFIAVGQSSNIALSWDGSPPTYAAQGGPWLPTGVTNPLMVDAPITLVTNTNYDVVVLVSKSYLVVGVNLNATSTGVLGWVLGLFKPSYPEVQSVYPPLMALSIAAIANSTASGVSRSVRTTVGSRAFSVCAGPESLMLGTYVGNTPEPTTNLIRASEVALAGSQTSGFISQGGYRGWLLDAVTVNVASTAGRLGDQITIGGKVYTNLSGSASTVNFAPAGTACGFFFDTAAGS